MLGTCGGHTLVQVHTSVSPVGADGLPAGSAGAPEASCLVDAGGSRVAEPRFPQALVHVHAQRADADVAWLTHTHERAWSVVALSQMVTGVGRSGALVHICAQGAISSEAFVAAAREGARAVPAVRQGMAGGRLTFVVVNTHSPFFVIPQRAGAAVRSGQVRAHLVRTTGGGVRAFVDILTARADIFVSREAQAAVRALCVVTKRVLLTKGGFWGGALVHILTLCFIQNKAWVTEALVRPWGVDTRGMRLAHGGVQGTGTFIYINALCPVTPKAWETVAVIRPDGVPARPVPADVLLSSAFVDVHTQVSGAAEPWVTGTLVASVSVHTGAVLRAGGLIQTFIDILTAAAVALVTTPALAGRRSNGVQAAGEVGTLNEAEVTLINVQTEGFVALETRVTGAVVAPLQVQTGAVFRAGKVLGFTLIYVLTVCSVGLKTLPTSADIRAVCVEAV